MFCGLEFTNILEDPFLFNKKYFDLLELHKKVIEPKYI